MRAKFTRPQIGALRFLKANGGLEVPNMNMAGRSKEWPTKRTLDALIRKGAIAFRQLTYSWRVDVTDVGLAALDAASGIETAKPLGREAGPARKGESPARDSEDAQ